ncbi:hypothetical protein M2404_003441 [Rheinheimera pacifica]|uniref:hypothetical protein n=1 Tax=Rheinheimera pacifica TaxID=173990 RepID=UPI002169DF3A|nr:hypothetical protein [Rheinheimera pacifica]MCS4309078.1 hypothetical protein [Rheinheimera pacifica]
MNNFKRAFEQGIKHADEAAENIAEINEVLDDFIKSIAELSGNKVKISVKDKFESESGNPFTTALAAGIGYFGPKGRHYEALVATNDNVADSPQFELCEWKLSEKGYPVRISYAGQSPSCADKESLTDNLTELISSPRAGKFFKQLIELTS